MLELVLREVALSAAQTGDRERQQLDDGEQRRAVAQRGEPLDAHGHRGSQQRDQLRENHQVTDDLMRGDA